MAAASAVLLDRFRRDAARWVRPEDVADPSEVTWRVAARLLWRHPALRATTWFRLGSWAKAVGLRGVPSTVQRRLLRVYGLELSPGADIDGGLYIAHPVGTVLTVERAGRDLTVIGSVTVGRRGGNRWPRLGDGVFLGVGCRVLGDVDIGDGARVGANAVVVHDVAPGTTVVGVPARPIA